jgi:hypothetical protein
MAFKYRPKVAGATISIPASDNKLVDNLDTKSRILRSKLTKLFRDSPITQAGKPLASDAEVRRRFLAQIDYTSEDSPDALQRIGLLEYRGFGTWEATPEFLREGGTDPALPGDDESNSTVPGNPFLPNATAPEIGPSGRPVSSSIADGYGRPSAEEVTYTTEGDALREGATAYDAQFDTRRTEAEEEISKAAKR